MTAEPEVLGVDVLVIGAGMSGITAAARCAEAGLQVVVLEKAPAPGGSALLSEGFVWTAPNMDLLLREDPNIDPELGRALVGMFPLELERLRSLGVIARSEVHAVMGFGEGSQIDVHKYIDHCVAVVESKGGMVATNVKAQALCRDGDRIAGADVETPEGPMRVEAAATVLATGGFPNDHDLRRRFLDPNADRLLLRANPYNTGDGLHLAIPIGAALSPDMSSFYGCLMPYPIERELTEGDFTLFAQYHSEWGILLSKSGARFCDESLGDRVSAGAVLKQQDSRAVLLIDEQVRVKHVLQPFIGNMDQGIDKIELAAGEGAHVARGDTWAEIGGAVVAWGYERTAIVDTVERYNADVASGRRIAPERERQSQPLVTPPFFALELQPAITMTYGGIRVDPQGHVLDSEGRAIPSLYAIGFDAGGLYRRGYAGGLARAIVTAALAAQDIIASRAGLASA